jgi:uncharacterized membrane protein YfcA
MPSVIRSVLAVVAGYLATAVIVMAGTFAAMAAFGLSMTSAPTPPYLAANLVVSFIGAVVGGWVCTRIAPNRQWAHAVALVFLFFLISLLPVGGATNGQPAWYTLALAFIGTVGVMSGAWIQQRGSQRKAERA